MRRKHIDWDPEQVFPTTSSFTPYKGKQNGHIAAPSDGVDYLVFVPGIDGIIDGIDGIIDGIDGIVTGITDGQHGYGQHVGMDSVVIDRQHGDGQRGDRQTAAS